MTEPLKFYQQPGLQQPSVIVGWSVDASRLGTRVTNYLNRKLGGQLFGEIEPADFFTLGGVTIEDNLVQFPESAFYACPQHDIIIFKSTPPSYEWHRFLNLIMDAVEHYDHVKELYAVGGMVSLNVHTAPRQIMGTFNSSQMIEALSQYNFAGGFDYETPPGQRPTLNSYLLWVARQRNIPGVTLWVPIPFYLLAVDDPRAQKKILEFLDQRLELGIDLSDLDEEIRWQDRVIAEARNNIPDIDDAINKLENNQRPTDEESQKLIKGIEKAVRESRN